MTQLKDYDFGTLRLKRDTIESLKEMKEAFDASYGKKHTMDEFIRQMAAAVEDGDPGVWEIYCTQKTQKNELQKIIEESQKLRKRKNK